MKQEGRKDKMQKEKGSNFGIYMESTKQLNQANGFHNPFMMIYNGF